MGDSKKMLQVRSARQIPVRVRLLDDELFEDSIDKRAVGWVLVERTCESLNLLERDYFGLTFVDATGTKWWLNNDKKISRQMKGMNWDFTFEVKFYPPDPAQLAEDLTRYQLCLQIRRDVVNEKLPCSFVTYTLLGSYTAQSELGDFDAEEFGHGTKYLRDIKFAPHQDRELLQKISELHKQHKGQTPEDAEMHFLENAKKLSMYGVELHKAQDAEGKDITLGVSSSGLTVYKDKQQINRFVWPKVLKISYRRNKYYIKIRPGEFEQFASLVGFRLPSIKMAKRLWKISIEHHSFFRFREPEAVKTVSLLPRFSSRFRFSSRTQFQLRQAVAETDRQSPYFDRVLSKRGTFHARTPAQRERDQVRDERETHIRRRPEHPPEHPPEPKGPPPVAPKPKKGPPYIEGDELPEKQPSDSLNASFDEASGDRKSRMDKMHAVATPLVAVMQQQSMDKSRPESDGSNSHGPPGYTTDPEDDRHREERDREDRRDDYDERRDQPRDRHMRREIIDQDVAPGPEPRLPLSPKEEKERVKREKTLEKMRKKEEEAERKRIMKEQKAAKAAEKKATKQRSKQKGKGWMEPQVDVRDVRERRDSKDSRDMSRDWQEAREQEDRKPATPDRTRKRLSSFEDLKNAADKEGGELEAPPTPPRPLPEREHHSDTGSDSEFEPDEQAQEDLRQLRENIVKGDGNTQDFGREPPREGEDHEAEEVSF